MENEQFRAPATVTQINQIRAQWERIHGPSVMTDLAEQHRIVESLLTLTGKADLREFTRSEATLYHEMLKLKPAARRPMTEADLARRVARL